MKKLLFIMLIASSAHSQCTLNVVDYLLYKQNTVVNPSYISAPTCHTAYNNCTDTFTINDSAKWVIYMDPSDVSCLNNSPNGYMLSVYYSFAGCPLSPTIIQQGTQISLAANQIMPNYYEL